MSFHVGQKVVCIDGRRLPGSGFGDETMPGNGEVYVVRDLCLNSEGLGCVRLVEIINQPRPYRFGTCECAFLFYRFRPLIERKTDISIFTALLTPKKAKELT